MRDWTVTTGDCIEVITTMEPGSVRLIVVDPPYNIGIDYGCGPKADRLPPDRYLGWLRRAFVAAKRLLAPNGSLWVVIDPRWAPRFHCMLEDLGLHWQDTPIWHETFGVYRTRKFGKDYRPVLWFTVHPKRYVFHRDRVESVRLKSKDTRADSRGRIPSNVWEFSRLCGTFNERLDGFPTQLPLDLPRRIVTTASDPGDLVLDPFSGSATTGVACVELGRRYVGIELNPDFAQWSRERLLKIDSPGPLFRGA
jgi:site-specific DNA-methyltransferase (adenine-specific)